MKWEGDIVLHPWVELAVLTPLILGWAIFVTVIVWRHLADVRRRLRRRRVRSV